MSETQRRFEGLDDLKAEIRDALFTGSDHQEIAIAIIKELSDDIFDNEEYYEVEKIITEIIKVF